MNEEDKNASDIVNSEETAGSKVDITGDADAKLALVNSGEKQKFDRGNE